MYFGNQRIKIFLPLKVKHETLKRFKLGFQDSSPATLEMGPQSDRRKAARKVYFME